MSHRGHSDPYNPYPPPPRYEQEYPHHPLHHESYPPQSPPKHDHHHNHGDHSPPKHDHHHHHFECSPPRQESQRTYYEHGAVHVAERYPPGPYVAPQHSIHYPPIPHEVGGPTASYPPAPYEGGRPSATYPPGRYEGGISVAHDPAGPHESERQSYSGPYGSDVYQSSPYASDSFHRPAPGAMETHRSHIPGQAVKIYCKANTDYHLGVLHGRGVVMVPANPHDDYQVWIKDETMGTRVKDSAGSPAFALVNKATGQALRHAPEDNQQVLLADYEPGVREETVLWTLSEDMGEGFHCIRMASKITSNLDALNGDKKSGGLKNGTPVILFKWKKQENQIWKIHPN